MKAAFEIEFQSPQEALRALQSVGSEKNRRGKLEARRKPGLPSTLSYALEADSFAALRARATSLLRDLKVVRDSLELLAKETKENKARQKACKGIGLYCRQSPKVSVSTSR